eukprot:4859320-Prymnesium_polylepis.1
MCTSLPLPYHYTIPLLWKSKQSPIPVSYREISHTARLSLGLWIHVHLPHGSGSPSARSSLAAPIRGLKVRPHPPERVPRVPRAGG